VVDVVEFVCIVAVVLKSAEEVRVCCCCSRGIGLGLGLCYEQEQRRRCEDSEACLYLRMVRVNPISMV